MEVKSDTGTDCNNGIVHHLARPCLYKNINAEGLWVNYVHTRLRTERCTCTLDCAAFFNCITGM